MIPGKLCSFRRRLGPGMHLAQGKIAEHKRKAFSKVLLQFLDHRMRASAVRALVISVFNKDAFRRSISLHVVFRVDGNG
jgi:hypothetical protein